MPVITALCEGPPSIAPAMHSWRRAGAPIGPLEGCRLRHRSPIRQEDVRERLETARTAQPGEVPASPGTICAAICKDPRMLSGHPVVANAAVRSSFCKRRLFALTGGGDHTQACRLLKVDGQCFRRGRSSRAGPEVEFPSSMNVHYSKLVGCSIHNTAWLRRRGAG